MATASKSLSMSRGNADAGARLLKVAINLLFVLCVASAAYVVDSVFLEEKKFFKKESKQGISAVLEEAPAVIERKHEDYSLFLSQIQNRNIFRPAQTGRTTSSSSAELEKVRRAVSGLRLVGIKAGLPPKVIIEDSQTRKTFYLKEGDSFSENIIVEKIGKDSVVLEGAGESFELYL